MSHDMQKGRERTSALESRSSNIEDEMAPVQRDHKVVGPQKN